MGLGPFKRTGFRTSLYKTTTAIREAFVGMLRIDELGRKYRYALAGGALIAGQITIAKAIAAVHVNEAILASVPIGETVLDLTVSSGTALVSDQLKGGMFQIQDGTGEGHTYVIASNTAISTAQTAVHITLAEPIRVALDTTSEFTLVSSPWWGITHSTGIGAVTGGAICVIASGSYGWVQTGGMGQILTHETTTVGFGYEQSTTSGAVDTQDTDGQEAVTIGYQLGIAGVAGDFMPCIWTID